MFCAVCEGEVVLLLALPNGTSSGTVSGISVKVSRAGSYAIEDRRRVGTLEMVFVDCGSGSITSRPLGSDSVLRNQSKLSLDRERKVVQNFLVR